ncbi:MAG: DVU0772 family protein [Bacillota bacterium]
MSLWKEIEDKIFWDFKVGDEFKVGKFGYAFVIDVYDNEPKLALYKIKKYSCESNPVKKQPDRDMLLNAVKNQGDGLMRDGLYSIDDNLKSWIKSVLMVEQQSN